MSSSQFPIASYSRDAHHNVSGAKSQWEFAKIQLEWLIDKNIRSTALLETSVKQSPDQRKAMCQRQIDEIMQFKEYVDQMFNKYVEVMLAARIHGLSEESNVPIGLIDTLMELTK